MGFPVRSGASVLVLTMLAAGCSGPLIESKKIDYKSAGQVKSLEVPPDLTLPSRDDRYAVPDIATSKGVATYSAYTSERTNKTDTVPEVLPPEKGMHIEREGNQRWLVAKGTPDALWPVLQGFWQDLGFIIDVNQPALGVMETDWAEDRAKIPQDFIRSTLGKVIDGLYSTPYRDKFRTRIEAGREPGTVDIYITHRGMEEIYPNEAKDTTIWQPRPADPGLEAEMLRRLMVRLGASEAKAKAAVAQPTVVAERAKLEQTGGSTSLVLQDSFDRAWRRVGLALDRVGFTVEDRNRAEGVYYVRYVDPDKANQKKDGFFSSLAFWRDKPKDLAEGNEFRILVKGRDATSEVQVLRKEGGADQSETAQRILSLLHDQLR